MKSNIDAILIDKEATELIVKICFKVSALKYLSDTQETHTLKKILGGGQIIQQEMDNVLGANTMGQFVKNLLKVNSTISELLSLYPTLSIEISNKEEIEDILKELQETMNELLHRINLISN